MRPITTDVYEPTWNSLQRHRAPEWLVDAKYGIYFHWGVYSVPACGKNGSWYPHNMYKPGTGQYKHHVEQFGGPSKFGYKEFIPMFTAEHFDPDEWARLIKEAGAKFAGPVAEHHDGFSMWDSRVNEWNAARMGPKRDVVGEMERAIRALGLKFLVAFHHAENFWFFPRGNKEHDTSDPRFSGLYGPAHVSDHDPLSIAFLDQWKAKIVEVIDRYKPDVMWFDFGLQRVHDRYKREAIAYYFNKAVEWGKEVGIMYKDHHIPPNVGMLDYELGRSADLTHFRWISDTSVDDQGAWSYVKDAGFKSGDTLVHNLVDRVAKNGSLLMNFGPRADGTIPDGARGCLNALGEWLAVNGESIYGTTPWFIAEEGPTRIRKSGGFNEGQEVRYTEKDIRFVVKGNVLYITVLGWPARDVLVKSLIETTEHRRDCQRKPSLNSLRATLRFLKGQGIKASPGNMLRYDAYLRGYNLPRNVYQLRPADVRRIELLGVDGALDWEMTAEGLKIHPPATRPCKSAFVFKLTLNE